MSDVIIGASVQVDTSGLTSAKKTTSELKEEVKQLRKEFENTTIGSEEQAAAFKKLKAAEDQLIVSKKTLNETSEKTTGSFSNLKGKIEGVPGPLGQAGEGVGKLNTAFKALLANPIVLLIAAIVAALTLLYKAFTSTEEGADKMEQIFAGLNSVINVLRDRFLKLAGAITSFFKGEWKEAFAQAREAYGGLGDEIAEEFRKAADAARELQEIDDVLRELAVSRAKLNRDLAQTKEIITDESASYADKKKAIDEVRKAEGEQTEQELANAQRKLRVLNEQAALSDVSEEQQNEIANQQKEVYRLEQEQAQNLRNLKRQEQSIDRQEQAKQKEAAAKADAAEKERKQKLADFNSQLLKLQQENQLSSIKDAYAKETQALEFKIQNEKRALDLQLENRKITQEQYNQLSVEMDASANSQRSDLTEKHNTEAAKREQDFQAEIARIRQEITLKGIVDARDLERAQLEIDYETKLNEAIKRYEGDSQKTTEVQLALAEQQRLARQQQEEKWKEEDEKKKLEEDEIALEKKITDEQLAYEERIAAIDQEQQLFQQALDAKLISQQEYNDKMQALSDKEQQLDDLKLEAKRRHAAGIAGILTQMADFAGKQTVLGKGLAIAAATIQTYQSAVSAYQSAFMPVPTVASPFLGVLFAASAVATGIATVKKIVSTKIPGGSDGGSVPSGIQAPAAPIAPQTQSTKIDASSTEDIGNSMKGGIKTFVVDADVSSARDRQERLERAATLGG